MALINCHECSRSISDKAHSCPHCGAPPPDTVADKVHNGIVSAMMVIGAIFTLGFGLLVTAMLYF